MTCLSTSSRLLRARLPCLLLVAVLMALAAGHLRAGEAPAGVSSLVPIAFDRQALPPRTVPAGPALPPVVPWVRTDLLVAHLPPADWRQIDAFAREGYQVIAVNTLSQWDRVGPGAVDYDPAVVTEADAYLRRFVTRVHEAGAKAVFYFGPVQSPLQSEVFRTHHPDWLRVNEDGSKAKDYVNFRHPGFVRWLTEQLAWLAREYQADGFWFDGYSPVSLHTYDDDTRAAFRKESGGHELPPRGKFDPRDPVVRAYLRWHEEYFVGLASRLREAVRVAHPETVIYGNYSASRTWYLPDWPLGEYPAGYATAIDLPSVELYWDNPGDALFQQFTYAFTQGVTGDRGARVWVQPQAHGISGTPPDVEILLRCLEGAPWGVHAEFVEPTGRESHMRDYAREVKARAAWWRDSEPLPFVGLVASEQTRTLYGRDTALRYLPHLLGAFRVLFEAHLPVRVLTEYDLEAGDLRDVRVLVLPETRVLSDRAGEVVRRFVAAGGGLLATGSPGLCDENFQVRTNFVIADLLQAEFASQHEVWTREAQLTLGLAAAHPIVDDPAVRGQEETAWRNPDGAPPAHGSIDLVAGATQVRAREGATVLVQWRTNDGANVPFPALQIANHGRGRVAYAPAGFDQAMYLYPNSSLRALLVNALRWTAGEKPSPVEVEAPRLLAVTYRRQPAAGRTIVHLLNDQSSYGRHSLYQKLKLPDGTVSGPWSVREEVIPIHDVRVRCRVPGVTKATQQPEGIALPLQPLPDGTGAEVRVPQVTMYSLIVFE